MIRLVTIMAAVIFYVTSTTLPLYAQWIPQNFTADLGFRVEYLLGTQTLGQSDNTILLQQSFANPIPPPDNLTFSFPNPNEQLRINFNSSQLVLDGVAEVTPIPAVSAQFRGSVSVLNADKNMTLANGPVPVITANPNPPPTNLYGWNELSATIKPQFYLWEVTGLYNLSYEDVYKYSLLAGYRQESWTYPTSDNQGGNSYLRDDFLSQIPFLGLQTVMNSPSWKARFEVIGSPFMTKKISHTARDQGYYMQLDGSMTKGGFIEFQVEGNINVTPRTLMGVYTQYSYESLKGDLTGVSPDGQGNPTYAPNSYTFYTLKSIWVLGLNCNVLF